MISYEVGSYVLAFFLAGYGVMFLLFASSTPPAPPGRGIKSMVIAKTTFLFFGILYLALSHFTVYSGLGVSIDEGRTAPCQNILANSTDVDSTTTVYSWSNSCANTTTPPVTITLFTILSYLLWLDFFALVIGSFVLLLRVMSKW